VRILFLTRSFNALAQRLYLELTALGHEVSIEYDISAAVTIEAVALYRPELIVAPFMKRAIPESVWRHTVCLVVHPGIVGDRGPSALDWAIEEGRREWGVTVLQADAEMDAGPVWASETFAMRAASKSSLYRNEVTEAATRALLAAVRRFGDSRERATLTAPVDAQGHWRPQMAQTARRIDWARDNTQTVLRKIRAADGTPGVLDGLFGTPCHLFDAHAQCLDHGHEGGRVIGRRHDAVLRSTVDGAVWVGHVRRADRQDGIKLPVALAFPEQCRDLPEWPIAIDAPLTTSGYREIHYEAEAGVGYVHFPLYNGAMSTAQCLRVTEVVRFALAQPACVLVLLGGPDFWSNGIHLNVIEAADSPADESWRNINAIDDLTRTLIVATDRVVIAAMQGNAGAGGVFVALAADRVWARHSVVLNPHYKNMGNLYGSEYWTYLLPRRLKDGTVADVMGRRLPMSASQAAQLGLVDAVFGDDVPEFVGLVRDRAQALAASAEVPALLRAKQARRLADESQRPLQAYRDEELARMHRNFYGFDPSYHIARSNFVHRVAPSWTPRHLCLHRRTNAGGGSPP
jgi:putative two-component system hydrogenase maturation factor HypX/HoxX